jgi:predicted anti-sigma-YlaC factor YlaD
MSSDGPSHAACREVSELLPWYVNGTLSVDERQRVDAHLPQCAHCRNELAQDRLLYHSINAEAAVEHMPAASLKRLQARLDGLDAAVPAPTPAHVSAAERRRRPMRYQGLLAASIAVMAITIGLLVADRWMQFPARTRAPYYYTVTNSTPHVRGEVIRAVFAPTITLMEVQVILDDAGLRIVSGPTEAGVYSLAANSSRPVSSSLAILRANAQVRFAESIQAGLASDTP